MRQFRRMCGAALLFAVCSASSAETTDVPQLLVERRCYACHAMEEALIGPPYLAIAARHAARADVMTEVLAQKIVLGGGGNWGVVPMVPNEHVTLDEARRMAVWILDLTKDAR
jgi:cytochrome c551/c552